MNKASIYNPKTTRCSCLAVTLTDSTQVVLRL